MGTVKKSRKSEYTPRSHIKSALRMLFLRSRERARALKRDKHTCQRCGKHESHAKNKEVKVEVHHKHGIMNWDTLFDAIYKYLLCHPDHLETLCSECHAKESIVTHDITV